MNDNQTNNESDSGANFNGGGGPQGDYAFVHAATMDEKNDWWDTFNAGSIPGFHGPFRAAQFTQTATSLSWTSRDNFARCIDGLSNQFFVGEKHIPIARLGKCMNAAYVSGNDVATRNGGDCSYLQAGNRNGVSAARAMVYYENYGAGNGEYTNIILRASDYSEDNVPVQTAIHNPLRIMAFGSWHPGICQFVLGDGSVRSISVTTPETVLRAYAVVDDGVSITLP